MKRVKTNIHMSVGHVIKDSKEMIEAYGEFGWKVIGRDIKKKNNGYYARITFQKDENENEKERKNDEGNVKSTRKGRNKKTH